MPSLACPAEPVTGAVVLVVQHESDCPPALLGEWLRAGGCALEVRRPDTGQRLPTEDELAAYDAVLVLGGTMDADDDAGHPWLAETRDLLRAAVATGLPVLGVCLGHQLLALALGGRIARNPRGRQVGLLEVGWTPAARADVLFGPLATPRRGVQWNQDLVTELPTGAELLAATPDAEVQVARFACRAWGVQLHPEVDEAVLRRWVDSADGAPRPAAEPQQATPERRAEVLRRVVESREQLEGWWRPLGEGFAGLAQARRHERERAAEGRR